MIKEAIALKSLDLILQVIEEKTRNAKDVDTDDLKSQITNKLNPSSDLVARIKKAEGFSPNVYQCSQGVDTIGYGRNVSKKGGISKEEAEYLLANDLERIMQALPRKIAFFEELSEARKDVLAEMAFQLGVAGLLKFRKFLGFLEHRNFEKASQEMLKSRWAKQTPQRAQRLAKAMLLGKTSS